jgi:molybdate transport repressor ModE-like protein
MHVDPHRLLVLDAVASTGSVAAAARRLHLVPSGVSQHIAALERETGLSLVDRSRRGGHRALALTEVGRRLAEHAADLRARLDGVEAEFAALTESIQGSLTVAAFPTSLRHLVLPARARLMRDYDAVDLRIVQLDESAFDGALHSGAVDVALLEKEAGHRVSVPGLTSTHLLDDRYLVAIPQGWRTPTTLTDLGDRPWVEGPPESVTATVLERHRRTSGLPFRGAHACLEYPAVLDLVDAGLGAALVPHLALLNHPPRTAGVVELAGLGGRAIHAAYLRQRRGRRVIGALLDSLRAAAANL